ncbi:MAG: DUF4339 domain-containing protein [Planctomycetia bacterium]|nr:DUF4339 domain-containing protein [Planctomycetia bacterium]
MPGFYKDASGQIVGPVSSAELKVLAERNAITSDTLIAQTANGPWVRAVQVKGLSEFLQRGSSRHAQLPSSQASVPTASASTATVAGLTTAKPSLSSSKSRRGLSARTIAGGGVAIALLGLLALYRGTFSAPRPIAPRPSLPSITVPSLSHQGGAASESVSERALDNRRMQIADMFLRAEGDWDSAAEKAKYGFTERCLEVEKQVPYDARGPLNQALVRDQEALSEKITSLREAFLVTLTSLRTSMETAAADANNAAWDAAVAEARRKVTEAIVNGKKAIELSVADRTDSFSEFAATAGQAASKAEGEKAAMREQLQADKERLSRLGDIRKLTSVAPEDAAALVRYHRDGTGFSGGQTIDLESLAELTPAVAKELSACTTGLVLPAVTKLSPESAKHLARMSVDKRNRLVLIGPDKT